ncbi:FAD1 flavin adenine dinucleotide synthetase [Coemansia erecta]|uniref:FAD synthase n=1 Tax=Coemansia erecta TaxID=147472 RepID=A0A9W7Y2Q5_9FUNG|nr:FAD1 flavin adenine dinucleotide synthetase [Coemansia erecta]
MVSRTPVALAADCDTKVLDFEALASATYGLATQQSQLGRKVANALDVIEKALGKYGPESIALSFNGGKDCTALMHLVRAALYKYTTLHSQQTEALVSFCVLYKKTFPEIDTFVQKSVCRYRLTLVEKNGPMRQGLQQFKDDCPGIQAIFVGTRRDDPYGDKLDFFSPTDADWPQFMRVNPVLDWSFDDIWGFIQGVGVPYCCLYDQGYTSLGDVDSTVRNPALCKDGVYQPAWSLANGTLERSGRSSSNISRSSANST